MTRHGGMVLAEMLHNRGVPRVFSVPGESFLAALDGLYEYGIPNIVCRHEGGAAMMAEATGKMTGQPGIAFVTRGPGATNASAGVHVAMQDSTPMILFVGQIATDHRDREAFQEVNYRAMFGPLAKWVAEIEQTDRLPEYVNRAFHVATSGRPGPVVLALPEDMLSAPCIAPALAPSAPARPAVTADQAQQIMDFLGPGARPLVVVGGPGWSADAARDLQIFAETQGLPVAVTFRRQDFIDNRSSAYVGDLAVGGSPALFKQLKDADRVLLIGTRLPDISSGAYETVNPANPTQMIAHVHPDPNIPGSVFRTDLAITAPSAEILAQLAKLPDQSNGKWRAEQSSARKAFEAWQIPRETPGSVKLEQVMTWLSDHLPDDAIVTNGAGNYAAFLHRYYRFRTYGTQLAPTSGSMGYGFPASIAASLMHNDKTIVCMAGDGCFQMTLNEMSTAMQFGAKPIVIVANNGRYGTIRAHQERHYPGRVSGTEMANPDFAALARSYGAFGASVHRAEEFAPAFEAARAAGVLAVIDLHLDPDMLGTGTNLSDLAGQPKNA